MGRGARSPPATPVAPSERQLARPAVYWRYVQCFR